MIRLHARTVTICQWTGLSEARVQSLARAFWADARARERLRGPPPSVVSIFWATRRMQREAAAMAGLCYQLGVLDPDRPSGTLLPGLETGENLCLAYETFLRFVPSPRLSLEYAVLLVKALSRGLELELGRCGGCNGLILVDRLAAVRQDCAYCRR